MSAPYDNEGQGAVWVFTRSGDEWTQQAKLTATGEEAEGHFGQSVALSADGDTAVIGSYGHIHGGVWIFARSGSSWSQESGPLRPTFLSGEREVTESDASFGRSVSVSSDGNTILVGDPQPETLGRAWVFSHEGSSWGQQGEALVGGETVGHLAEMGYSVALSPDGNTALIGGDSAWAEPTDYYFQGAAWVFTRTGTTWAQQGTKFTAGSRYQYFGTSVALAGDGASALISGPLGWESLGGTGPAVWSFTQSNGNWVQAQELRSPEGPEFGLRLTSSEDGETALIQGTEGVWVYELTNEGWKPSGEELITAGGSGSVPDGLALSAFGETAVVGEPVVNEGKGSAIVYLETPLGPPPSVTNPDPPIST